MTVFSARFICSAISRLVSPVADQIKNSLLLRTERVERRVGPRTVAEAVEDPGGHRRVQRRLAGRHVTHRLDEVVAPDLLEDVARSPGHDRGKQCLVVVVRREDQGRD